MENRDNIELSSHEESQVSRKRPFSYEVAQWLRAFRIQWVGHAPTEAEPEKPKFGNPKRFMIAFLGAFTFWFFGLLIYILNDLVDSDKQKLMAQLDIISNSFLLIVIFSFALSAWFAWLISWRDNQFGPVRIYLSALLLSAFVFEIISRVWPQ